MSGTPEWLKARIRKYYEETTEKSYLANWSGAALSFHYGLADETTTSLDEAHYASNRYMADHLGITEGIDVLDAGCGVGGTSLWLAAERKAKVVGVTIEPHQVELGTRFAAERGVADRVTLEVADYAATGFAPGSFDVVLNLESLCHCIDVREYFRHVRSLLRPGGRYGCMEFFVGEGQPELVQEIKDGWAMPNWQTSGAVADALRAEGFVDVETTDLVDRVRLTAQQMKAMANNSLLVMKLQQAIDGKDDPVYSGHVRGAIAAADGLFSGGVTYHFVRARKPAA
jgi:cyclopropane fatty-acyl-phospholipid synthase-like methyltransferase